jgi:predicted glycosyltransferase
MLYTGYLPRGVPAVEESALPATVPSPFLLVTAGGGGDGAPMIDWVLRAYESGADLPWPALVVMGPFMSPSEQKAIQARVDCLERVSATTFDAHLEVLLAQAAGVVSMGGYNTFCEILSLDKPAILVPRTEPRREQLIRAQRADKLGLVRTLNGDGDRDTETMIRALRTLPTQSPPSNVDIPGLLSGLETINQRVVTRLGESEQTDRSFA